MNYKVPDMEEAVCAVKDWRVLEFQDCTEAYENICERLNCVLHIGLLEQNLHENQSRAIE